LFNSALANEEGIVMDKINIALVGCGGMAGAHVEGYRDLHVRGLRVFDVKATCDVSEENAGVKAHDIELFQNSKPKVYTGLEKLLKNESLDAVDICLPHNIHHLVAIECLNKGLHVIIEKPMAVTMRAAKLMMDKADKSGKTLAVAENYRWDPKHRSLWWAIQNRLIGEPRIVLWTATSWGPKPWGWRENKLVAGGSWVFDGGVHWADLDRYQLGREAIEVFAATHTFDHVKEGVKVTVDDMTMAIIKYEDNVYAQWLWTRATPAKGTWSHAIYGSKGALSDEGLHIQKEEGKVETQPTSSLINSMRKELPPEELERFFPKGSTNTIATELHDFYMSIIDNKKPEVDAHAGYKDMAIPLGFYESAHLGRTVKIKDVEELRLEGYQREINEKLGL
jgi:predicted dehydrogenase